MSVCALVVAAGRGSRARLSEGDRVPKQYAIVGGKSVLAHTVETFVAHPEVARVMVVIHRDDEDLYQVAVRGLSNELEAPIFGGDTRQASVLAGLEALAVSGDVPSLVLIHDAARPFVDRQSIDVVLRALDTHEGAVCAVPIADTLKRAGADGRIVDTVDRKDLWRAQTPQAFRFKAILDAHRKAMHERGGVFTDDSAIAEWAGLKVALVMGAVGNDKLTSREDVVMADERLRALGRGEGQFETRIGTGFDVHRFGPGDHVWLCGCRIDHTHTLVGHSDADVGLHALTDAILGALGEGDIGQHFPPSDLKWKGARSDQFLADAAARVARRGGAIVNVDVTLVCELPKVGPHREAMRVSIASIAGIDVSRVGVKATTTEKLGFTGRGEGIAAMASVSIKLPD